MLKRTSNPWKTWGLVGFCLFGAGYAGAAYFGDINFIDDLELYFKIAVGAGAALVGCALASCAATVRYCRQRVEITNQELMDGLINADGQSNRVLSSHYLMEQALKNPASHANACSNLVRDFNQELAEGKIDNDEYIAQAKDLKKEFLKRHPDKKSKYLLTLKAHGYLFHEEPEAIFSKMVRPSKAQAVAIQITPVTSPPETPTTQFYKASQNDDDLPDLLRTVPRSITR